MLKVDSIPELWWNYKPDFSKKYLTNIVRRTMHNTVKAVLDTRKNQLLETRKVLKTIELVVKFYTIFLLFLCERASVIGRSSEKQFDKFELYSKNIIILIFLFSIFLLLGVNPFNSPRFNSLKIQFCPNWSLSTKISKSREIIHRSGWIQIRSRWNTWRYVNIKDQ